MKSPQEVATEIDKLKTMAPQVRPTTIFGDDNRAAINAQIRVLTDNMSDDDIYDTFGDDKEDFSQHTLDLALDAAWWRDGAEPSAPSESWADLVA